MHKKPTDYFQYTDFLSQYNKFRITPRPPPTPTSTNSSSHPPQPSSPSIHSYSELYTTKQELHNCQLFLNEATNNFTLLDTKYKHDIQTMQTALNVQKCQYEQMLSEMKSKHTNNIKRIA